MHFYLQDSPKGGKMITLEMTEEQAVAEQQRMFAEARARMNNGSNPLKEETNLNQSLDC